MGKIVRMTAHLANMIAAGEVVEKPASVVKELVENAIDACATDISVYLKNGGIEEIKVVDNGDGMDSDDVLMAFIPHATSKIKAEYDLFRIKTLGFRGEAIASISAVSETSITSSTNGISGFMACYKAGVLKNSGTVNSNKGTTIVVSGLFFNTPARLKYLKSPKSELASISFLMDKIALGSSNIKFRLYNDSKLIMQTSASNSNSNLIGEIYGVEAAKRVITDEYVSDGYKAKLIVVKPEIYRANKLDITIIINNRYVKNYDITNSVIEAFHTYLPIGKYPICVLYFDIDPLLLDVNVHPAKTEIKLANIESLCMTLNHKLKDLLQKSYHVPTRVISKNEGYQKQVLFESVEDILPLNENVGVYNQEKKEVIDPALNLNFDNQIEDNSKIIIENTNKHLVNTENVLIDEQMKKSDKKLPYMEYIGQAMGTYLIFQNSDGLYLVDQHAAQERINYEKYYNILKENSNKSICLISPIMLEFSKSDSLYLEQNLDNFMQIGFEITQSFDKTFVIRQIPLWLNLDEAEAVIYEILEMFINGKSFDVMKFRDNIAKSIACKASIKANMRINKDEAIYLVNELNKCNNPYTCPHGRPSVINIKTDELKKMFERIQK